MATHSFGRVVLVIVLGAMIGTLFGKLVGLVLPEGVVKEFFLKDASFGVGPADIDVGLFAITLGFKITLNIVGLLGVSLAIYLLRWYF
ncbi:MAG TPA: DUF4321 domain-containing protein [bacterium]